MLPLGLNHVTMPHLSARGLIEAARDLGCSGVELRNDLPRPLFDGHAPGEISETARAAGIRIFGLAEVKAFNHATADKLSSAAALMDAAVACGAEGVALIPMVGTAEADRAEQRTALRHALALLQPMLEARDLTGLIEPLGFVNASLRFKSDVVAVLDDLQRPACFGLVHDTFHHHLAGEDAIYADLTRLVHVSGVVEKNVERTQMTDAHRVLVDAEDRLGNVAQLRALQDAGYTGPASFECFAPQVQNLQNPIPAVSGSIAFITAHLTVKAA